MEQRPSILVCFNMAFLGGLACAHDGRTCEVVMRLVMCAHEGGMCCEMLCTRCNTVCQALNCLLSALLASHDLAVCHKRSHFIIHPFVMSART